MAPVINVQGVDLGSSILAASYATVEAPSGDDEPQIEYATWGNLDDSWGSF